MSLPLTLSCQPQSWSTYSECPWHGHGMACPWHGYAHDRLIITSVSLFSGSVANCYAITKNLQAGPLSSKLAMETVHVWHSS